MSFILEFDNSIQYDAGLSGISIDVSLKLDDKKVDVAAKIDTGSTDCIFSRETGKRLGLEIEDSIAVNISTATGYFKVFQHFVTLNFLDIEFDAIVFFAENESFNRNILGRHYFLDQLKLGLIDYEGKLFLSRYAGE